MKNGQNMKLVRKLYATEEEMKEEENAREKENLSFEVKKALRRSNSQ
jgi:hypothetical protein